MDGKQLGGGKAGLRMARQSMGQTVLTGRPFRSHPCRRAMGSEQARFDGLCRSGDIVQVRLDLARHGVPFPGPSRRGVEHHSFLNDQHPRDAAHARAPKRSRSRTGTGTGTDTDTDTGGLCTAGRRRVTPAQVKFGKQGETLSQCIDLLRYAAVLSSRCRHDHSRDLSRCRFHELLCREMTKFRLLSIAAVALRRDGQKGGIRRAHAVEAT